ncbi:MAG: TonB family protein [Candidatus Omnitrophica bacterium]|nr:TonB family protein [Candidatus Omnitrophota bacterium]
MRLHFSIRDFVRRIFCLVLMLSLVPLGPLTAKAAISSNYDEMPLIKGDMINIPAAGLLRVSVTDPNIADISDAKANEVTVIGKEPGQTDLFLWDSNGKRTLTVRVVEEDLDLVKTRLEKLLETDDLQGLTVVQNEYEGKVIVTGTLPEDRTDDLQKIVDGFDKKVLNMVKKEKIEDLVQIDVQITELSTTLTKALGVDWVTGTQTIDSAGKVTTAMGTTLSPAAGEILPGQDGSVADLFKIGKFYRTTNSALVAKINMLIQEGKARILSKPRLVVLNGKEATFNVGGEIPIKTITTAASGGTQTENVTFKQYGVTMSVTPTIRKGKIDILLNTQISDIDSAKPTGSDVAFLTRTAQTQLFLDDHQTIVLAGLIKRRNNETVNKVPFFSSIPIIGMLFRSKSTPAPNEETEVVISLTPTIIHTEKPQAFQAASEPKNNAMMDNAPALPEAVERDTKNVPVITKNAASLSTSVPAELAPYAKAVQEKISAAIAYPYEAQKNGWQGTVKLSLNIKADGTLKEVFVKDSSGYEIFDQDAMNTAQLLAPYAPFPMDIQKQELSLTIPIVYSLDAFLKNIANRN